MGYIQNVTSLMETLTGSDHPLPETHRIKWRHML